MSISARVLIMGATSAIAVAVARRYASRGARLALVGRRMDALDALAADLRVRGAGEVVCESLDVLHIEQHAAVLARCWARWDGMDRVLVAHGVLPDQQEAQASPAAALASFDVNARTVIALLTDLAARFEQQGAGALGVISSPAAERGRASNYVYGAAKAAVSNFCGGLRHRLFRRGVRVITILPGFVDTPMTAGFAKGPLWASPDRVARDIEASLERSNGVVYTPGFWGLIMLLVRNLPEWAFLRSKL